MSDLLFFNKPIVKFPNKILYYNKKTGKDLPINTLTKTGNISRRNKKPAIRFETHDANTIETLYHVKVGKINTTEGNLNGRVPLSRKGLMTGIKAELRSKVRDQYGNNIDRWSKKNKNKPNIYV